MVYCQNNSKVTKTTQADSMQVGNIFPWSGQELTEVRLVLRDIAINEC